VEHRKSKKRPPTTPSPGDESRRWREGTATLQNAEIGTSFLGIVVLDHRLLERSESDGREAFS